MLRRVLTPLPLPSWWMDAVVTLPRFCVGYWLVTRIAGAAIAVTMLVAALVQKADASLWEKLPSLGFLWVALYAIVLGSRRFGLDYLLFTRKTPAST